MPKGECYNEMKVKTCIGCKHISNKDCGKITTIRGSSGAITYAKKPGKKCRAD